MSMEQKNSDFDTLPDKIPFNNEQQQKKHRLYFVTWHIKDGDNTDTYVKTIIDLQPTKYAFQIEKCPETQRLHVQAVLYFGNGRYFTAMQKSLPGVHLEKVRNVEKAAKYCQKYTSRVQGPWVKGFPVALNLRYPDRPWQQKVIEYINAPEDVPDDLIARSIMWVAEQHGCVGKTHLCKFLCSSNEDTLVINGHSEKHILFAVAQKEWKTILFDFPMHNQRIPYATIEKIRNGLFFTPHYESKMTCMRCPKVVVFANQLPDIESTMAKDRWIIYEICDNDLTHITIQELEELNKPPAVQEE